MKNENNTIESDLLGENIAHYAGTRLEYTKEWIKKHYQGIDKFNKMMQKIKPERLEVSCAIITDCSVEEYIRKAGELIDTSKIGG